MNNSLTQAKQSAPGSAPIRGSFPADRFHECDETIDEYYKCLKANEYFAPKCRQQMKMYLQCRVKKGLLTKKDYEQMRLKDEDEPVPEFSAEEWKRKFLSQQKGTIIPGVSVNGTTTITGRSIDELKKESNK